MPHRLTDTERRAVVEEWLQARADGATQEAFAARHSVSARALRVWIRRYAPSPISAEEVRLVVAHAILALEQALARLDAAAALPEMPARAHGEVVPFGSAAGMNGAADTRLPPDQPTGSEDGRGGRPLLKVGPKACRPAESAVGDIPAETVVPPAVPAAGAIVEPSGEAAGQNGGGAIKKRARFSWDLDEI